MDKRLSANRWPLGLGLRALLALSILSNIGLIVLFHSRHGGSLVPEDHPVFAARRTSFDREAQRRPRPRVPLPGESRPPDPPGVDPRGGPAGPRAGAGVPRDGGAGGPARDSPEIVGGTAEQPMELAICGIVKDEAPYLAEWIEHHKSIGADHILLYNDRSSDDTQCVLDAYAQRGDVTRVPEDIESRHMDDLPWMNAGKIPDNPQNAIFEACRRYLADRERGGDGGGIGSTWMLTNDVDEFLWFDRESGDAKDALARVLSELPPENRTGSVRIPNCVFGPDGNDAHEPRPVMGRFARRHGDEHCSAPGTPTPFERRGKAVSRVSSVSRFLQPEKHLLAGGGRAFANATAIGRYVRMAHYMTKSREEFYSRVCGSRYFNKYFNETKGRRSPAHVFDFLGGSAVRRDERMLPFAEGLASETPGAASGCNTEFEASRCPNYLMETEGEDGFLQLVGWRTSHEPFQPLVFGAGLACAATAAVFDATCELQLRSLHYGGSCGFGTNPKAPLPGLLAHIRLVRSYKALVDCIVASRGGSEPCPSVRQTLDTVRQHIDRVISAKDVGAIHGRPYPEFADYVLDASERIRGTKPIVLLSTCDPEDSTHAKANREALFCQLKAADDGGSDRPIGQDLYRCLRVALRNGLGDESIINVFHAQQPQTPLAGILGDGVRVYQERMEGVARYRVDLIGRAPRPSASRLASEIDAAAGMTRAVRSVGRVPPPPHHWFQGFRTGRRRLCVAGRAEAFASGRRCGRLVVLLDLHGAGSPAIVEDLRSWGMVNDLRTNANPLEFREVRSGDDIGVSDAHDALRIHSSANDSRASDPNFWSSLYDRGLDFVSLEDNFVAPHVSSNFSSAFKITQLRNPWDRFYSTYERERDSKCGSGSGLPPTKAKRACLAENSLEKRLSDDPGATAARDGRGRRGIPSPNYYVRVLNGMTDSPRDAPLTRDHLELAKAALASFDTVLVLEDGVGINLSKLRDFFGDFSGMNVKKKLLPTKHGNMLMMRQIGVDGSSQNEEDTEDETKTKQEAKTLFEEKNKLDIELYEFARDLFKGNDKFDMRDRGESIECRIPAPLTLSASNPETRTRPEALPQRLVNVHGWPHSGTGFLRRAIHQSLEALRPGSSSVQDSSLHGGRYVPEHEGQYLQSVYPEFDARRAVYEKGPRKEEDWMKHYGKLMYLADTCAVDPTSAPDIGNFLFREWSRYFNTSAEFLIQKTPTLDVQFLESVKVMPTFHVIIVRHPMAFKYMRQEKRVAHWRPFSWLDSVAHVLGALAEGEVQWYAVVTYEALVQYYDQVVEELMAVVRSGMDRLGHNITSSMENHTVGFGLNTLSSDNKPRHNQNSDAKEHRRLELRESDSSSSYLNLTEEAINQWKKCLKISHCNAVLEGLTLDILPHFGYVTNGQGIKKPSVPPGSVAVSESYGHVLFSSEGTALQQAQHGRTADDNALHIGHQPPMDLIQKMNDLLKNEAN